MRVVERALAPIGSAAAVVVVAIDVVVATAALEATLSNRQCGDLDLEKIGEDGLNQEEEEEVQSHQID